MSALRSLEVRRFYQVAVQRMEDARVLLDGQRTTGAMYLAGYAAECALKALLLASVPLAQQSALVKSFRGRIWHDLAWLKRQLVGKGVNIPADPDRRLIRVSTWSTDLRYTAGREKL